jgi:hypothetical protein
MGEKSIIIFTLFSYLDTKVLKFLRRMERRLIEIYYPMIGFVHFCNIPQKTSILHFSQIEEANPEEEEQNEEVDVDQQPAGPSTRLSARARSKWALVAGKNQLPMVILPEPGSKWTYQRFLPATIGKVTSTRW